jgi:hypothetical protein
LNALLASIETDAGTALGGVLSGLLLGTVVPAVNSLVTTAKSVTGVGGESDRPRRQFEVCTKRYADILLLYTGALASTSVGVSLLSTVGNLAAGVNVALGLGDLPVIGLIGL